jgi:hypothetical protein
MKKKLVIISLAIEIMKVDSLVALFMSISLHTFRGHGGSSQQEYSSSNCYVQVSFTYHHVFYVKPYMFKTPKLWFHVLESISSIMNIEPIVMIVTE